MVRRWENSLKFNSNLNLQPWITLYLFTSVLQHLRGAAKHFTRAQFTHRFIHQWMAAAMKGAVIKVSVSWQNTSSVLELEFEPPTLQSKLYNQLTEPQLPSDTYWETSTSCSKKRTKGCSSVLIKHLGSQSLREVSSPASRFTIGWLPFIHILGIIL